MWHRLLAAAFSAFGVGWAGGFYVPPLVADTIGSRADTYYVDRLDFLRSFPPKADIAMVGDSLTHYADWDALIPDTRLANLGISGDKVATLFARLDTVKASGARHIFLEVGVNDIAQGASAEETFKTYQKLLQSLAGLDVTVQSTFPTRGRSRAINDEIAHLNRMLSDYCRRAFCTFVDLTPTLSDGGELRGEFTNDGMHLNAKGYAAWRDAIAPLIARAASSAS